MSRTYTEWAKRNLALNDLATPQHGFVQADVLTWLKEQQSHSRRYDLMFIDPPTHSRSKRLEDDFDVQRDHASLLSLAAKLLAPGATVVFSNNYTRFKLDPQIGDMFEVEDWSARTLPWDFRRSPRIHRCFRLELKANAAQRSAATG